MRTAFAADVPRKTALWDVNAPLMVAISAGSASLRATIEALARRCGAQVSAERGLHDLLLMALDSSTPLPTSVEALTLLIPSGERVCVIWTGTAPPRGTVSRLLRAGVAGAGLVRTSPAPRPSTFRGIPPGGEGVCARLPPRQPALFFPTKTFSLQLIT